jgi:hypothetical protein
VAEISTIQRTYLTRKEAAEYLRKKWFPISAASLERYASDDTGPPYHIRGARALYDRADLDAWAVKPPLLRDAPQGALAAAKRPAA